MAWSKISDLNSLFAEIYEGSLFVARENNIMTNLVTNYSARGWMARNLPIYAQVTAESIGEGEDFSNPTTWSKSSLAILTPGEIMCQVVLTDRRIETDPDDARRDATVEMGNAVATKIDVDLVGTFASFSSGLGTANNSLTINIVAAAISQLRNANAPNPLYVVLHPYGWHDIWDELGTPASNLAFLGDQANAALRSFFVGSWLNVTWFTSSNISVDGDGDAIGGIFNPQALAFDTRKAPLLEPERDASARAWELNLSAGYAYGVRRTAFGRKLTHDATAPTS
jgi:hypothetical protein